MALWFQTGLYHPLEKKWLVTPPGKGIKQTIAWLALSKPGKAASCGTKSAKNSNASVSPGHPCSTPIIPTSPFCCSWPEIKTTLTAPVSDTDWHPYRSTGSVESSMPASFASSLKIRDDSCFFYNSRIIIFLKYTLLP